MRKKFTMLLASLFLTLGTSVAQTAITQVSDLSETSAYTIKTVDRGYLYYDEANQNNVTSVSHTDIINAEPDGSANQLFAFLRHENLPEGNYYLYSLAAKKFVSYTSGVALDLVENPSYIWTVVKNGDNFLIKIPGTTQTYINVTNEANGASFGCKVASTAPDGGNKLVIKSWTPNEEQTTTIADAKSKIDKLYANAFDPTKLYRVYNKKKNDNGTYADTEDMAWSPEGNHLAVYNAEAENQLWRFIQGTGDNAEKYLIYNVATGKYMREVVGSNGVQLTAKENEAVYYTMKKHASENKYAFCSRNEQKNHLYNDGGGKLAGWTANDNEYFTLEAVEVSVDVTYSFKFDGVEKYTQTESLNAGDKYPDFKVTLPYGVSAEAKPAGRVGLTDINKDVELTTSSLPFEFAATYESVKHWYHMSIHSGDKYYLFYEENDVAMDISNVRTVDADKRSEFSWAFVGDPFTGYKIVNRAAGANKILSASTTMAGQEGGSTYPVLTDITDIKEGEKNTYWIPTPSTHATGGFYLAQKDYPSNRMNYRNPNLSFWTGGAGAGSTFQIVECGVLDLKDLSNEKAYMLAAERSPLMYSTKQDMTTKLSSGMVDGVAAKSNDERQQFLVLRSAKTQEGKYYLYSVAAGKFVAADLTFTDVPAPVLSFEANEKANKNNVLYPWYVKINGKYVVPGDGGTAGNKLYHDTNVEEDDGKRFNIVEAGDYNTAAILEKIRVAENLVKTAEDLQNNRVYTVTPADNASTGVWDVKYENGNATMLAITKFTGNAIDPTSKNQQFAFLNANGEYYLYSYGAEKFVAKNGGGQMLTDDLSSACRVEFLNSTISSNQAAFPLVVKVGGSQLHSSYQNHLSGNGGIITTWNHTESGGNALAIVATYNEVDLSDVVAKVETYQINGLKSELSALITEAQAYAVKEYIHSEALEAAITAAQGIKDKEGVTYSELTEQITALSAAIDEAAFVTEIDRFSNTAVYVFKGERGYLMYDGTNDYLASTFKQTSLEAGDEVLNCQWVVYTSASGKQYMYNLGAKKFMGTAVNGDAPIPFSATPQSTGLIFKKTLKADYPIMMSANGGAGAVNHVNSNDYGIMNWHGGFTALNDLGNSHQVRVVGELDNEELAPIKLIVAKYEFEDAVDEATARFADVDDKPGYYSCTEENATKFSEIKNWSYENATVEDFENKTAELKNILDAFTINLPVVGKFYRLAYDFGTEDEPNIKYVQAVASNVKNKANAMVMTADDEGAASIFYYDGGANAESADDDKLLSYSAGQYVREIDTTRGLQPVGGDAGKTSFAPGSKVGKLYVTVQHTFHANKDGEIYFVDHCPTQGAHAEHNFIVEEVTTLPVNMTTIGEKSSWATLYAPVALTIPDGVTAYTGTVQGEWLTLTEVKNKDKVIPANTAVILNGTQGGAQDFAVATTEVTITENALKGTVATIQASGVAGTIYTLQREQKIVDGEVETDANGEIVYLNNVVFGQYNGDNLNGFRAYLPLNGTSANSISIRFEGTTDIEHSEIRNQHSEMIFDLLGRRVEAITKGGIYIVNGKKVVVK